MSLTCSAARWFIVSSLLMLPVLPAVSETIQLEGQHGTYMVPVRINDAITLPFVLDTGASDVAIPTDVFLTLKRTGTVASSDFIGKGTYILADGTEQPSDRFVLHQLKVGNHVVKNVIANVTADKGDPLLGQSFLSKLPSWAIDNERHALVLNDTTNVKELIAKGDAASARTQYVEAMKWYRMAADQGDAGAEKEIGWLYARGLGVTQDLFEATRWYRRAATKGNREAESWMAGLYWNGWGLQQDYVEAARWSLRAASKGDVMQMYNIGHAYEKGQGVVQNYSEAVRWLRRAAENGDAESMNALGLMYIDGKGVGQDCTIGKKWLNKAAAAGSWMAEFNLGAAAANCNR